jgi:hypothetical protein
VPTAFLSGFPASRKSARRIAVCAMALPIALLCGPFIFSSRALYSEDFMADCLPRIAVARQSLLQDRELPRWNPYQFAGTPILGNGQSSYYYPPHWLGLLLPIPESGEALILLHLILAAAGMYRLARSFRLSRTAAVMAGLGYALGFGALARVFAGHLYYFMTHGIAPWMLYAVMRVIHRPTPTHVGAVAVWTFAVVVGGAPQWGYLVALVTAALTLWQVAGKAIRKEPWIRPALGALGGAVLGSLLSAVELLPALEVARHSVRGRPLRANVEFLGWYAISREDLVSFITPCFAWAPAEHWMFSRMWHEKSLHTGILPLLASFAAPLSRKRGPVLFFGITGAVGLLAAMALPPVNDLLLLLPWYGNFRIPARTAWIVILCVPMLGALGWDAITRGSSPSAKARIVLTCMAAAAIFGAAMLWIRFDAKLDTFFFLAWATGAILVMAFVKNARLAALALYLQLGCELFFFGRLTMRTVPRERYAQAPWYAAHLGPERSEYRVLDFTGFSQHPSVHGFRILKGYSYPILQSVSDLYGEAWEGDRGLVFETLSDGARLGEVDVFRTLNVRWIVASSRTPAAGEWREIAREGSSTLFEDRGARPLAFLDSGDGTASARRPTLSSIDVDVRADRRTNLIVSEAWMPGWQAWCGSQQLTVVRAYRALLSVEVPEGDSRVRFVYRPPAWRAGMMISSGAALVIIALFFSPVFRRLRLKLLDTSASVH